ncbi:heme-binding protein 2-like [Salvelinus sp. IW2-2015]|uniref:heme-binding protein 2-like n=1 Tax=Salvelinus sp. IW2-2015 TaxID=2691554 RepID=UPI000CDFECF9|nr:heme-binding protein 2-like [Salvelinus alpinus]
MVYLAGLVGLVLILTAEARVGNSSESRFCTESKECLLYDLVCKNDDYEVRHYDSVKWVSTDEEAYFMDMATYTAFRRLFNYITGSNKAGVCVCVVCCYTDLFEEKKKTWGSSVFTLSFLLPSTHQMTPPQPTDDKVYFTEMPDMKVYVRSYGGWMMSLTSSVNSMLLKRQLDKVQATYNKDYHYAVGYDSPKKILNRHNEVWYIVEGEPVCPTSS